MTLDELYKRPDFVTLSTVEQKTFTTEYCSNGADKIAAANAAYRCKDRRVALATANRALRHPAIAKIVADFYGDVQTPGDKDAALLQIWQRIQKSKDDETFFKLMTLYGKWKGFEVKAAPEPPDAPPEDLSEVENILRG